MTINQIVKDQIRHTFEDAEINESEVIEVQNNNLSRINLDSENVIRLKFKPIEDLELNYITTFFKRSFVSKYLDCFFMVDGITLRYMGGKSPKVNHSQNAMEVNSAFENLYNHYLAFYSIISKE